MTLPSISAVDESMKFLKEINDFSRLIGFKTVPEDIQKAKIDAEDRKKICQSPDLTWT